MTAKLLHEIYNCNILTDEQCFIKKMLVNKIKEVLNIKSERKVKL